METVFYGEEVDKNAALGTRKMLTKSLGLEAPELKSLFRGVVQQGSFTLLKHLYIECCPSLITVFSSHLKLKNLEVLKIKLCNKIEGCSKIKRLPVSRKTTSSVKIKGEAVWWNDLEWEDEEPLRDYNGVILLFCLNKFSSGKKYRGGQRGIMAASMMYVFRTRLQRLG
ncbi:hypothetical protein FRX31_022918, partial [Thalictrum thalictroides]